MKENLVGLGRFLGLVLICTIVATLAVAGLRYKVEPEKQAEQQLVSVFEIEVQGTAGKVVSDIYGDIGPSGPIRPYELMCAAHQMRSAVEPARYSFEDVLFPGWFYPGDLVSPDTECSLDGNSLRKKFPNYQEIGS
jgi:hypothetical protein